jgi:hypothetical protein
MPIPGGSKIYLPSGALLGTTITKTTADDTITFPENSFNRYGAQVRELIYSFGGYSGDTTISLENITRVKINYGQTQAWNVLQTHVATYMSFVGKKSTFDLAGNTHQNAFTIPLHLWRGLSAAPGQNIQVTLSKNNTFGTTNQPTCTQYLGVNPAKPGSVEESMGYANVLGAKYGIPASATNFPVNLSTAGYLIGFCVDSIQHMTGLIYNDPSQQQVINFQDIQAFAWAQEYLAGNAYSVGTNGPIYFKMPTELPIIPGVSQFLISTDGSWTDKEITLFVYFPNQNHVLNQKR